MRSHHRLHVEPSSSISRLRKPQHLRLCGQEQLANLRDIRYPGARESRAELFRRARFLVEQETNVRQIRSGLFMAFLSAKPVGPSRSLPRRSGMAHQARPVGQRVSARHRAGAEPIAQLRPRLLGRRVSTRDLGNM